MKPKKNPEKDLRKDRLILFEAGMLLALSLVLLAFEWKSAPQNSALNYGAMSINFDEETVISTPRDPEPVKIEKPKLIGDLVVVDNDTETPEATVYTEVVKENEGLWDDGWVLPEENIIDEYPPYAVTTTPLFNGKDPLTEFGKFINKHIDYPEIARDNGIHGRVVLQFIINEQGMLTEVRVIRPVHPVLDAEAVRVVNLSPRWTPGKVGIKNVRVVYQFPVVFRLQ